MSRTPGTSSTQSLKHYYAKQQKQITAFISGLYVPENISTPNYIKRSVYISSNFFYQYLALIYFLAEAHSAYFEIAQHPSYMSFKFPINTNLMLRFGVDTYTARINVHFHYLKEIFLAKEFSCRVVSCKTTTFPCHSGKGSLIDRSECT